MLCLKDSLLSLKRVASFKVVVDTVVEQGQAMAKEGLVISNPTKTLDTSHLIHLMHVSDIAETLLQVEGTIPYTRETFTAWLLYNNVYTNCLEPHNYKCSLVINYISSSLCYTSIQQ